VVVVVVVSVIVVAPVPFVKTIPVVVS